MKNTGKIAFCGIMSALAVVVMLAAYFPYITYAVPIIAGVVVLITYIETDIKWSLAVYIVSSIFSMLFCETEAKLIYVFLFGYYPILKVYIEKIPNKILMYVIKFAVFNASLFVVYGIFAKLFGLEPETFNTFGIYGVAALVVVGNIAFFLYDICLVRVAGIYMARLHKTIKKFLLTKRQY